MALPALCTNGSWYPVHLGVSVTVFCGSMTQDLEWISIRNLLKCRFLGPQRFRLSGIGWQRNKCPLSSFFLFFFSEWEKSLQCPGRLFNSQAVTFWLFLLRSTNTPGLLLLLEFNLSWFLYLKSSLLQICPLLNHFFQASAEMSLHSESILIFLFNTETWHFSPHPLPYFCFSL